jgi:hypothetical protein
MLQVKYIGAKASQSWVVNGRSVLWERYGATLSVPDDFEKTIAAHPGNWEIVGHAKTDEPAEMPAEIPEKPDLSVPLVDLNSMDKTQLHAYLQREFGQNVDQRWSADRLRKYVRDQMGQRQYEVN